MEPVIQQEVQNQQIPENQEAQLNNIFDYCVLNWPKHLQKLSIKYKVVQLDEQFLEYLLEDGVYIHKDYCRDKEVFKNYDEEDLKKFHKFNENIFQQITQIINEYGKVYPKINWKSPMDVQHWCQDLKIEHIEDLLLAFKNSGLIGDMLQDYRDQFQFQQGSEDNNCQNNKKGLYLILKKFYKLNYKNEFRCFVYNNELRAICQKHTGDYYKEMKETNEKNQKFIEEFFETKIKDQLKAENDNFVFDIYIEQKIKGEEGQVQQKIYIIDIEPWQEFTNPLLYTFDEIQEFSQENKDDKSKILFKYIEDANSTVIRDYTAYRVPEEVAEDPSMENITNLMEMLAKNKDPSLYQ